MKKYNNKCPICKKQISIPAWKYCSDKCEKKGHKLEYEKKLLNNQKN